MLIHLIQRNKYKEAAKIGRQRNRPQTKEQENSPELHELGARNLSHREFRVMIIRILKSMKKKTEKPLKKMSQKYRMQYLK